VFMRGCSFLRLPLLSRAHSCILWRQPENESSFVGKFVGRGCIANTANGAITEAVEALADLAERHHLQLVFVIELYCGSCGFYRLGLSTPASGKVSCPGCGTLRPVTALGRGYTAQPTPLVRYLCRAVPKLAHFWGLIRGYRSRFRFAPARMSACSALLAGQNPELAEGVELLLAVD
jgi:hypothetical protein